jgi:signal transduction histidine kinase
MSSINNLVKVKNLTLLFIIGVILSFSAIILYFGMKDKQEHIQQQITLEKTKLDLVYTKKIFELQKTYNEKLEEFVEKQDVIDAFAARDRDALGKVVQPYFQELVKENKNFQVMCFGLPNMTAFYRAHAPDNFGDDISQVQGVFSTITTKKRISGFMVAKLGIFYRVTFPVYKDGTFLGVIAFAVDLDYVNNFINKELKTPSAIVVKTNELKKIKWYEMLEEGEIGSYTIISSQDDLINQLPPHTNLDEKNIKITLNDKYYEIINDINIYDINNRELAKIILFQDITQSTKTYLLYLYSFITILVILVFLLGFVLLKTFDKFLSTIISINDDLKDLNHHLAEKIEEEVAKNREKEKQLFEQSKRSQLGEMIGNIAHQWRQPLSIISTASSGMILQKEMGVLNDEEFYTTANKIVDTTQFLSQTIDHFRDFLQNDTTKKELHLQKEIDNVLYIIDATLSGNHIQLQKIYQPEDIIIQSIGGEIAQVVLNIMNNAKDILIERDVPDKKIILEVKTIDNIALITIEDNAGGIPEDILPKIFDPYFTTKHQAIGTGIGLYMSNSIVTQSLHGKIYVKNTNLGAKFFIELPMTI